MIDLFRNSSSGDLFAKKSKVEVKSSFMEQATHNFNIDIFEIWP